MNLKTIKTNVVYFNRCKDKKNGMAPLRNRFKKINKFATPSFACQFACKSSQVFKFTIHRCVQFAL